MDESTKNIIACSAASFCVRYALRDSRRRTASFALHTRATAVRRRRHQYMGEDGDNRRRANDVVAMVDGRAVNIGDNR